MVGGIDVNSYFTACIPNKDITRVDDLLDLNWGN